MLSNAYSLENFVLVQPRTSPPKICKNLQKLLIFQVLARASAAVVCWCSGAGPTCSAAADRRIQIGTLAVAGPSAVERAPGVALVASSGEVFGLEVA